MSSYKTPDVQRQLIMEHYSNPLHKNGIENKNPVVDHYSSQCVDEIHLHLDIKEDVIIDVTYDAVGCAVFLSSTDLLLDAIKGKTIKDAKYIIKNYEILINGETGYDEPLLQKLNIFFNVGKRLNRLHCAKMISDALNKFLNL